MSLTIEDGTLVIGANSFASVVEARSWAASRGAELPATDAEVEVLLVKAADFILSLEDRFKGTRVSASQALCWPRSGVDLFGSEVAVTSIPSQVVQAQCQLCIDLQTVELQPTGDGREVVREKTDVLETEYRPSGSSSPSPRPVKALSILQPLLKSSGFSLVALRV